MSSVGNPFTMGKLTNPAQMRAEVAEEFQKRGYAAVEPAPATSTNQPGAPAAFSGSAAKGAVGDPPRKRVVALVIVMGLGLLFSFAGCQSGGGGGGGGGSAAYARGYRDGKDYEQLGYSQGVCASAPEILRSDGERSDWVDGCYAGWSDSYNR